MNQYSSEPSYLDNLALLSLVVAATMVVGVYFEDQTPSNKRAFGIKEYSFADCRCYHLQ